MVCRTFASGGVQCHVIRSIKPIVAEYTSIHSGQRRRISLPVRGAGYELLIPFRGYSAELKRERIGRVGTVGGRGFFVVRAAKIFHRL